MRTKILIVLRVGAASLHRSWTAVCAGRMDIAISAYDDSPIDTSGFVAAHRGTGGKFQGLAAFFAENAEVIDSYTHFWLLDDDLYLPFDSVMTVRDMIERFDFALCAPSLAPESFFSWPITIQNSAFYLRATDFVEVMAPVMSRAFLQRALPYFAENQTGWGYEWLWRNFLAELNTFAAILDAAPVVHTRPIGAGSLYDDASGTRISGVDEAAALFEKHAIDHETSPFRNLFALSRRGQRPVFGSEFLVQALRGYPSLLRNNRDLHKRCQDFLASSPRALGSVEQILAFDGAPCLFSA